MKRTFVIKTLILFVIPILTSCSSMRVLKLQEAKELPKNISSDTSSLVKQYERINLEHFFNDPNLIDLFRRIEKSNPDYQITLQKVQIAAASLKQSKASFFPEVDLKARASGTRFGDYTMEGVGNYDTNLSQNIQSNQQINRSITPDFWVGAGVSWEVDLWGRLRNKKKAANQRFLASKQGVILLKNQLFTQVAQLYYQLVSLDKKLLIYEENSSIQQIAYEIVLAQRVAGKATELAVQQFSAQSQRMKAEVEHLRIEIMSLEKTISNLLGEYNEPIVRNRHFDLNYQSILDIQIQADSVIHQRPDVSEAYHELLASHADAKAARAAFFPKLEIGAFGALNSFSIGTFFNPASLAWQILGGLTAPIFKQGQLKYNLFAANREQEIAFLNYQKSITNSFNELSMLINKVVRYQEIIKTKSLEVQYLDRAVDVSNSLYLTGYANYWEIINSQKLKIQAEIEMVDFQYENIDTAIQLYKALGGEMK